MDANELTDQAARAVVKGLAMAVLLVGIGVGAYFLFSWADNADWNRSQRRIESCLSAGGTARTDSGGYFDGCTYPGRGGR